MLDGFRKHSNSIIVKGLFVLLIASFALWGVGDMLQPAVQGGSVASVGHKDISAQEVYVDYQREMARMRQLTGGEVTMGLATAVGGQVVDRHVNRALLSVKADDLDIAISDEVVAQTIRTMPVFQDEGRFSRARFEQVMFSNQMNEDQYIELVRDDLAREQLTVLFAQNLALPKSATNALYQFREEKRVVDVVRFNADSLSLDITASDSDLQAFYDANQENYRAPEYRAARVVHITPQMVARDLDIPLENIEDAYAERQAEFTTIGTRTINQMVFNSQEEATTAYGMIQEGQLFASVAQNLLGLDAAALSLGTVTRTELPDSLQAPVFALESGAVSEPIETPLGWHLVEVTARQDAITKPFEEVKAQLRFDLALQQAGEEVFGLSNDVEDALGGGATLEEAASQAGLTVVTIDAIDANGLNPEGLPVSAVFGKPAIVDEIFTVTLEDEAFMKDDGEGGYFMVGLNSITETTIKPFDAVKDQVRSQWERAEKQKLAEQQAQTFKDTVFSGTDINTAAVEIAQTVSTVDALGRFDNTLPRDVVAAAFDAQVGDVVSGPSPEGAVVAVVRAISSVNDAENQQAVDALAQQVNAGVSNDLQAQYLSALRSEYTVSVDQGIMNSMFSVEHN